MIDPDRKFTVSVGRGVSPHCERIAVTWDELIETLADSEPGPKGGPDGIWWSPILWKGNYRKAENFESAELIALDLDNPSGPVDAALPNCLRLIVPSWSWTPDNPRYRLVVPLERALSREQWLPTARFAAELVGADSVDCGRLFFTGTHTPDVLAEHVQQAIMVRGSRYYRDIITESPIVNSERPDHAGDIDPDVYCTEDFDESDIGLVLDRTPDAHLWAACRSHLGGLAPVTEGRHDHGVRLIGELCAMFPCASRDAIEDYVREWVSEWHDTEEPRFWSHLDRCFGERTRLLRAKEIVDEAAQMAAWDERLGKVGAGENPAEDETVIDLDAELPPVEWISKPLHWARGGRVAMVAGKGSSMKTSALLDAAVSLARGEDVWGIPGTAPTEPLRVLWVDYEMGRAAVTRKLQKVAPPGRRPTIPIRILEDPPPMGGEAPGAEDHFAQGLGKLLDRIDVVFIDNLSAGSWVDENSKDIRIGLDNLRRQLGEHMLVVLIHHVRKSSAEDRRDGISGHAAIYNALGSCLLFERDLQEDPNSVKVSLTKPHTEHDDDGQSVPYRFGLRGDRKSGRFEYTGAVEQEDPAAEKQLDKAMAERQLHLDIIEALRSGLRTEAEILDRLGSERWTLDYIRKQLKSLEQAGRVMNRPSGGKNVWITTNTN